mmetsp:Transcript_119137/g.243600  ORF Transcript_119137/g.243600 Transcript_119137/m.243600 type:complete len:446 (-) Transcript_119137:1031-2368(-)
MKLTARNTRTIHSAGSGNHQSQRPLSKIDKNPRVESRHATVENDGYNENKHSQSEKRRNKSGVSCIRRLVMLRRLSNFWSKFVFFITISTILPMVFFRVWDQLFCSFGDFETGATPSVPSSFAVVINTYRRPERLQQTVRHYAQTCGKGYDIGQIFIVWADPDTEPPPSGEFFFDNSVSSLSLRGDTVSRNHVPVEVLRKSKNSLNARFEPIPQLRTTSVFMVDDDIRVACHSLQMGFQAWKEHQDSMVGYYPRLAGAPVISPPKTGVPMHEQKLVYLGWPVIYLRQKFNIVLTKASFLHSKYLELYTNDGSFPKEIKNHVDRHRNCEDIAMSMLVANYTKHNNDDSIPTKIKGQKSSANPVYVQGEVSDVGLFGGISSGTGHYTTRTDCLNQLTEIFRSKGWEAPLQDEFDLLASSWVKHAPGFWWQPSPSNIAEWFGLMNIFS